MDAVRAVERLTRSIEDFNSVFIRLPASDRLNFSALSVLHTLSRLGPCRLSDLVRTEQIKQPALTSAVAKLERDGLIERRPDPRDGRASMLSLTADGQSIVSRRHSDRAERLRSLIDRLSPADRTRLLSIAGVLDQIVQLAGEHDENLMLGAGSEYKRECTDAGADRRRGAGSRGSAVAAAGHDLAGR